jgi:DNA-directed RNA polymerase II subunit RPB1
VLVSNEGLAILNLLKIQSAPFGNIGDSSGDEMNLHMPQDEESEAELKNLAAVPYQIISPANNQSIIGIFQDSLLGSYQFTRVGVKFDSRAAMNLLMALQTVNESMFSNMADAEITNFDILSQIMPPITIKYKKTTLSISWI